MFLKTSRYYKVETVESSGQKAVKLRRLPKTVGGPFQVKSNHRLDIIAQQQYKDPTMFWHIADANSRLEANGLVEEDGRIIEVPEK